MSEDKATTFVPSKFRVLRSWRSTGKGERRGCGGQAQSYFQTTQNEEFRSWLTVQGGESEPV